MFVCVPARTCMCVPVHAWVTFSPSDTLGWDEETLVRAVASF